MVSMTCAIVVTSQVSHLLCSTPSMGSATALSQARKASGTKYGQLKAKTDSMSVLLATLLATRTFLREEAPN